MRLFQLCVIPRSASALSLLPCTRRLHERSAVELARPELCDLVRDGNPVYAWSYSDRHVRAAPGGTWPRLLARATAPRS